MSKCKRCGRDLKNKDSIKLGYGKSCFKKKDLPLVRSKKINKNQTRLDKYIEK